jgi:hypothetical protein
MTNTKQWDAPAAQQLVRYEALTQLFEDILAVDDLVQIARRVATRWKYFANVACWRLVVVDAEGYLVIDGIAWRRQAWPRCSNSAGGTSTIGHASAPACSNRPSRLMA